MDDEKLNRVAEIPYGVLLVQRTLNKRAALIYGFLAHQYFWAPIDSLRGMSFPELEKGTGLDDSATSLGLSELTKDGSGLVVKFKRNGSVMYQIDYSVMVSFQSKSIGV